MYKFVSNSDNFGFNIISKINSSIIDQENAFGTYQKNKKEFDENKEKMNEILNNSEYLTIEEQNKYFKVYKIINMVDSIKNEMEIKNNNYNQPTLCMSLFYGNLQNFSGENIKSYVSKYISNQIRAIIAFKIGFPDGNVKLLFDKFMLDKFSSEFVDIDETISYYISDVDIDNKNKIVRSITHYNNEIKLKISKLEKNNSIKINTLDKILLMYDTASNLNKNIFIEMFAYEFSDLFTHETISKYNTKVTQAITNGYIGQLIRYLSVIQDDYLFDNNVFSKSRHIVIRDGHAVSPGKFDCEWINELNIQCYKNNRTISMMMFSHYYKKIWNGDICCCENIVTNSSPAGWSQFAMFGENKNFITRYKKIITLPFIITNDEKNIPFLNFRNNKTKYFINEKKDIKNTLIFNNYLNYGYGIDEFLLSTLISDKIILQHQMLVEFLFYMPNFNYVNKTSETITITCSFIILLYVYVHIFEYGISFLKYLLANVFHDHLDNLNKLKKFVDNSSDEIIINGNVIKSETLNSLFIMVYNKYTTLNLIRINDISSSTNVSCLLNSQSLQLDELQNKLETKLKYYICKYVRKNVKTFIKDVDENTIFKNKTVYENIFLEEYIFWFNNNNATQCESILILLCLYCFCIDKKDDIDFISDFNYENIVIVLLKMKKTGSNYLYNLIDKKLKFINHNTCAKFTELSTYLSYEHFITFYLKLFENIAFKFLEIKENITNEKELSDKFIIYNKETIEYFKTEILQCINFELGNIETFEFYNLIGDFFKIHNSVDHMINYSDEIIYITKYDEEYDKFLTTECNVLINELLLEINNKKPYLFKCNTSYLYDASLICKNKIYDKNESTNYGYKNINNIIKCPSDIKNIISKSPNDYTLYIDE